MCCNIISSTIALNTIVKGGRVLLKILVESTMCLKLELQELRKQLAFEKAAIHNCNSYKEVLVIYAEVKELEMRISEIRKQLS